MQMIIDVTIIIVDIVDIVIDAVGLWGTFNAVDERGYMGWVLMDG